MSSQDIALKRIFKVINGSTPKSDNSDYWDGDIPWVTPIDLNNDSDKFIRSTSRQITKAGLDSCGTSIVPSGSIIISCRAPIGSIGISPIEMCTNQGCKSLVKKSKITSEKFYYFVLTASNAELNSLGRGTTFLELSTDALSTYKVPNFSIDRQEKIANFLDRETAKIDELIQKQKKLIDLLGEERKSKIKHTVTKGLNQNVVLKDSEIQWIGAVPVHWKISPLKRLINIQNGADHKNVEAEDGFPVYGSGGIFSYANNYLYDGESILLGRKGTIDKPLYVNGKFWTVDTMYWSKILPTAYAKFVYYLATIIPFEYYSTSTALPSMTKGDLGAHIVAYPDIEEQKQISTYLDEILSKTDSLITKANHSIELLNEHRASLISAAVTGKIDVRELV